MFKKLLAIFSLEKRVIDGVSNHLAQHAAKTAERLIVLEKDIAAKAQQIDKLKADLSKRLAFLEYHFKDELEAKEKTREAAVTAIRLGK
jgi:cell division protein FtsB